MIQNKKHLTSGALCILLFAQACTGQSPSGADEPATDALDSAAEKHSSPPPSASGSSLTTEDKLKAAGLPDTSTGREILAYMVASRTPPGEAATRALSDAKTALKLHAHDSATTLAAAYEALAEDSYATRANLVFVLGELESTEARDALSRIMKSGLPPERYTEVSEQHREYGSQDEERRIRSIAIEGIARLARDGDRAAAAELREMAQPRWDRVLRWTSIARSLHISSDPSADAALMSQLDEIDHAIFQTRRALPDGGALHPDVTLISRPALTPISTLGPTVAALPCRDCKDDGGSPPVGALSGPVVCGVSREDAGIDDQEIVGPNGWNCRADWINYWWGAYAYDSDDWAGDWGYYNGCDTRAPLARTFNANWLINQVDWFSEYAPDQIDELDPSCSTDALATTVYGPIVDNYTELKPGFFFELDPISRAGTIVHEARHAAWQPHTASDDSCSRGGSCDSYFGDEGPNSYQIDFLRNYAANASNPLAFRQQAVNRARLIGWIGFQYPEYSPEIPDPA